MVSAEGCWFAASDSLAGRAGEASAWASRQNAIAESMARSRKERRSRGSVVRLRIGPWPSTTDPSASARRPERVIGSSILRPISTNRRWQELLRPGGVFGGERRLRGAAVDVVRIAGGIVDAVQDGLQIEPGVRVAVSHRDRDFWQGIAQANRPEAGLWS